MGLAGCRVIIYESVKSRTSGGFHEIERQYTGPDMNHYHNFTVFPTKTRSFRTSDTVEFLHTSMNVTQITLEDKLINGITKIKSTLAAIPTPNGSS